MESRKVSQFQVFKILNKRPIVLAALFIQLVFGHISVQAAKVVNSGVKNSPNKGASDKLPVVSQIAKKSSKSIMNVKLGPTDGGGGGVVNPDVITMEQLITAVREAKRVIQFTVNSFESYYIKYCSEGCDPWKTQPIFEKMFKIKPSIVQSFQNLKIEINSNTPCKDEQNNHVDGSIHASEPGRICLSGKRLIKKLDAFFYREQLMGLIFHELTHLAGANEEEAVMLQKEFLTEIKNTSEQTLLKGLSKIYDGTSRLAQLGSYLLQSSQSNKKDHNCGPLKNEAQNLNDLKVPYVSNNYPNYFNFLSATQEAKFIGLEYKAKKLMQKICSMDTSLGDEERAEYLKKYLKDFNGFQVVKVTPEMTGYYTSPLDLGNIQKIENETDLKNEALNIYKESDYLNVWFRRDILKCCGSAIKKRQPRDVAVGLS